MKLGQTVIRFPSGFCERSEENKKVLKPIRGTVVYIQPKRRFYTVEFDLPGGKLRESFPGAER